MRLFVFAALVTMMLGGTASLPAAPTLHGGFVAAAATRDNAAPQPRRIGGAPAAAGDENVAAAGDENVVADSAPLALPGAGMVAPGAMRRRGAKADQAG